MLVSDIEVSSLVFSPLSFDCLIVRLNNEHLSLELVHAAAEPCVSSGILNLVLGSREAEFCEIPVVTVTQEPSPTVESIGDENTNLSTNGTENASQRDERMAVDTKFVRINGSDRCAGFLESSFPSGLLQPRRTVGEALRGTRRDFANCLHKVGKTVREPSGRSKWYFSTPDAARQR